MTYAQEIVRTLNVEIFEAIGDSTIMSPFLYSYDGIDEGIEFLGVMLWNTANDERKYIDEEKEEKEDLLMFVRNESIKMISLISKIDLR